MTTQLNTKTDRTEVLSYGSEKTINEELEFFSKAKRRIDICIDCTQPQFAITNEKINNCVHRAKNRTAKTRCITEITDSNLTFCKELMRIIGELRHLEGVKANFMVSEKEYLLTPLGLHKVKSQRRESPANIIYSSAKQIVEQQQYLFDSLWSKAIPAEQRIKEMEEGRMHYETRIIDNSDEIVKEISHLIASSNELVVCLASGGMQYSHKHFTDIKKKLLDKQKKGEHKGIRYVTNIDSENVHIAKIYLDYGVQIKHVRNLPPLNFGVSDKEIATTIEKMENGNYAQSLLISNDPTYLDHFRNIFEEVWENGINATARIKDIEEGRATDNELAYAKGYLDEVLQQVNTMKNKAIAR